ncbi:MAG: Na-translocating system protein MpsC family protein [Solirubrobacterales bacterium]
MQETATDSVAADISREIVRIYSRFHGRGPTKARTVFHGDMVVTVLEEVFTKVEEVLVRAGRIEQIQGQRQAIEDQIGPLFRQAVESLTGRSVRVSISQVTEEGIAVEVFVLTSDPAALL